MRIAAFTKYGSLAASTRQRMLQYIPKLEAAGIAVDYHPLLGHDYVASLASGGRFSKAGVAAAYLRRMRQLITGPDCDLIWVYAELFPYLPAAFERLAFRSGKPVVYDFDDAFFHQYDDHPSPVMRRALAGKLEPLLSGAAACCCGNAYLQDYARRFCERSIILPTVVDTDLYGPRPAAPTTDRPVIGWIGSPSTWPFLRPLLPVLEEVTRTHRARLRVVGAGAKARAEGFAGAEFVQWGEQTEVADVQSFDIGIMPLPDEQWARGKSGYKLIQYMACELPVVASPVGVNGEIVVPGATGYLAADPADWRTALVRLIGDPSLRRALGAAGRARAVELYSLNSQAPRLIELVRSVSSGA